MKAFCGSRLRHEWIVSVKSAEKPELIVKQSVNTFGRTALLQCHAVRDNTLHQ